jgi:hypothetical protein
MRACTSAGRFWGRHRQRLLLKSDCLGKIPGLGVGRRRGIDIVGLLPEHKAIIRITAY